MSQSLEYVRTLSSSLPAHKLILALPIRISYEAALAPDVKTRVARMLVQEEIIRIEGLWEAAGSDQDRVKVELFDIMKEGGRSWEDMTRNNFYMQSNWQRLSESSRSPIRFFPVMASGLSQHSAIGLVSLFYDMGVECLAKALQIVSYLKRRGILSQSRADKVCKHLIKDESTFKWHTDSIAWLCHIMTPAKFAARVSSLADRIDTRVGQISMPKGLYKVCREGRTKK